MSGEARNISFDIQKSRKSIIRPSNTDAYAAGDVISAVTSNDHFTFTILKTKPVQGSSLLSASIERAIITSSADVATAPDLELWLFDTDIAEVADNAAFAPTDAEILTCLGVIDFPTGDFRVGLTTGDGNSICQSENLNMSLKGIAGDIFGQLVVRNAYVPISAEVFQVTLFYQQD